MSARDYRLTLGRAIMCEEPRSLPQVSEGLVVSTTKSDGLVGPCASLASMFLFPIPFSTCIPISIIRMVECMSRTE